MNVLFGFSGRIGRLQWWGAQAAALAVIIVCIALMMALIPREAFMRASERQSIASLGPSATAVWLVAIVLTNWIILAATVKRFHDRDKSGWWYLIVFVPLIGVLWQIVECGFLPGSDGGNDYGHRDAGTRSLGDLGDDLPVRAPVSAAPLSASRGTSVPVTRGRPSGFGRRGV